MEDRGNFHRIMVQFLHPDIVLHHPTQTLIPFHEQAFPLPDPQQSHTTPLQVVIATTNAPFDPIPFTRFFGPFHRQIHQPQFLSVNTTIYDEGQ